jgi:hypothetical protein
MPAVASAKFLLDWLDLQASSSICWSGMTYLRIVIPL